ncbi:MAG: hypothetical protein ABR577_16440 [Pyrinomonadaceae bacterium]
MKRAMKILVLALLFLCGATFDGRARKQELSPQLKEIAAALESGMKEQLPEWEFARVAPLLGSSDVLIEFWSLRGRRVKVSILLHASEQEAVKAIENFIANERVSGKVSGIGDKAYAWGYGDEIAFRKKTLTVYVSADSQIPTEATLDQSDKAKRERAEQSALNKNFARLISTLLFAPPTRRDIY